MIGIRVRETVPCCKDVLQKCAIFLCCGLPLKPLQRSLNRVFDSCCNWPKFVYRGQGGGLVSWIATFAGTRSTSLSDTTVARDGCCAKASVIVLVFLAFSYWSSRPMEHIFIYV
uniref:Uncharacterized protein n=1 Tax=Trypanosoma vivax (strain Y486) TaxID=1055687 RepID=G0U6L5_TRYVY|nr:hypothetical protein TVY486_1005700 [Trypanosoma vivax Y486]